MLKILKSSFFVLCLYACNWAAAHKLIDEADRLVNLVNEKLASYQNNPIPVDNSEFFGGATGLENPEGYGTYDFIVIGAGSAGAIVASRLADELFTVLLIEAGGEEDEFAQIPAAWTALQNSNFNWGYKTTPQKASCLGMNDQQCHYPRGKALGGSSVINAMGYVRGNRVDLDSWASEGITGWSYDECLPYFKKFEHYGPDLGSQDLHGFEGPINVERIKPSNYFTNVFLHANEEIYSVTDDYNGHHYLAADQSVHTKKNGRRVTTANSYLANKRSNLNVTTHAMVHKLNIRGNHVDSVLFVKDKKYFTARAVKEVIVSGGAINSPQILMLSGIGSADELQKHGIDLVADLPVGLNMEDHVGFYGLNLISDVVIQRKDSVEERVWQYISGSGSLTQTGLEAFSFLTFDNASNVAEVELIFGALGHVLFPPNLNLKTTNQLLMLPTIDKMDKYFIFVLMLLHPKSRGSVTLQSSNPIDFPVIDPNSLSHPDDVDTLLKAIRFVQKLVKAKAMRDVNTELLLRTIPACLLHLYDTDPFWKCMIHQISHTIYHCVGTCRMGLEGANSVVDNRLKVHGIDNLRVIDVSVVPISNSGHTAAWAMMIGERGADLILQDSTF